jgi:hypothetical protein
LLIAKLYLDLSCSTRVSNELGAGRPNAARLAVRVVIFLAIAEGLLIGLLLICIRYVWGHAYSDVEEVVTYVAQMMLIISVSNFFDGIQCVLSGIDCHHFYFPQFSWLGFKCIGPSSLEDDQSEYQKSLPCLHLKHR